MKNYYPIEIVINKKSYYCIWYTNDTDGIIIEVNLLKYFYSIAKLKRYCHENSMIINEDVSVYSLDKALEWILSDKTTIDCKFILSIWNIMSDLSRSTGEYFYGNDEGLVTIYNKLFYGNNLPALNAGEDLYTPSWCIDEILLISKVLHDGIDLFEKSFSAVL